MVILFYVCPIIITIEIHFFRNISSVLLLYRDSFSEIYPMIRTDCVCVFFQPLFLPLYISSSYYTIEIFDGNVIFS